MSQLTLEENIKYAALVDPDAGVEKQVYKWDKDFIREILSLMICDRQFLVEVRPIVKPVYFIEDAHRLICEILFSHFDKYHVMPTKVQLMHELRQIVSQQNDEYKSQVTQEFNILFNFYNPGLESREYYREKITNFAKIQALKVAFADCLSAIKKNPEGEETWTVVQEKLNHALAVDHNFDMGLDYFETTEERYATD